MPSKAYNVLAADTHRIEQALTALEGKATTKDQRGMLDVSFRLLAHAAIETYLEVTARALVIRGAATWKKTQKLTRVTVALALFYEDAVADGDVASPKQPRKAVDLKGKIDRATSWYMPLLDANHGIREDNLRTLFGPLGCVDRELDPTLVATLDTLGKERGAVAHSTFGSVSQLRSLADEVARVTVALKLLRDFDKKLGKLR